MADHKWKQGSVATILSTGLNSLANGALAAAEFTDQDTNLDLYADFELVLGTFVSSVGQGNSVAQIYLLPTVDGSNYPDGQDATLIPQQALLVGAFEKRTATGTTGVRCVLTGIPLPQGKFKVVLYNTSSTYAATGNTLKMRPYKLQTV